MELTPGTTANGFTVKTHCELPEINGTATTMIHAESGAQLLYLANDDSNKSFAIGFKTPPADDTGVFHILEHSVLCGSDRFPVKEPFVDLLKTSMQTFLNAMTFSDKTLYPVASTNEQDLLNLMDVYLDAVFHPQIYRKRAIFEQEGWHLELHAQPGAPADDVCKLPADQTTLSYNGVVYNEMKGALSDANAVLGDELQKALFPDTCYAFESGGMPTAIPTLTYEHFLDEHTRHYRTDNSYIVLYGNVDIDRALAFIDERYLTPVAREQRERDAQRAQAGLEPLNPRTIEYQAPVKNLGIVRTMDTAPENACAAAGYVIGTARDRLRVMAVDILLDALFGSNEAPAKRALLDRGVANDVSAWVADSFAQPFASIQLNVPHDDAGAHLDELVRENIETLLANGIDHELIEASLSHSEFQMREHMVGTADGVSYSIVSLSGWLYDDDAALDYLRYEQEFKQLRTALEDGFFEALARELFLENDHIASAEVVPTPGVSNNASAEELAARALTLTADERAEIVAEEELLRALQEAPDAPEDIATLPRLGIADIGDAPEYPLYELDESTPVACLRHYVPTNGIVYAYRYFDANRLSFEDLPYLTLLSLMLGKLPTARHTAAELDTLTQGKLGNLSFFADVFENVNDLNAFDLKFVASASALSENVTWLSDLPREIMLETQFNDKGKVSDILAQQKIRMEQLFLGAGHICATARATSHCTPAGVVREHLVNLDFYAFLCDLIEHFDERADELAARLADLAARLFGDDGCTFSFAGSEEDFKAFWASNPVLGRTTDATKKLVAPAPTAGNEGFTVPSDVSFTALAWDRRLAGIPYSGTWAVVARVLSYDYLWNEVRVKGGAYGVGFTPTRIGGMRFYSFRDPHINETLERFGQAQDWLADFNPEPEAMDGFIVATVASLDTPIKPRMLVRRQAGEFFCKQTPEDRLLIRQQAISTSPEDLRAAAETVGTVCKQGAICSFGARSILESATCELEITNLLGE